MQAYVFVLVMADVHASVEAIVLPLLSAPTLGLLHFGVCTLKAIFYQYINDLDFPCKISGGKQLKGVEALNVRQGSLCCHTT